jgi:hypothetical protein
VRANRLDAAVAVLRRLIMHSMITRNLVPSNIAVATVWYSNRGRLLYILTTKRDGTVLVSVVIGR